MRYEEADSNCGKNNFWGNGCPEGTPVGGASIQGNNLGEGFVQYAQTLTNGSHDQALGISDPKEYLEKIGHTWVYGPNNPDWSLGYGSIDGMKNSVDALQAYIDSPEGQAIVKTFGNYHENSATSSSTNNTCGNGNDNNSSGKCTSSGQKIADLATEMTWSATEGESNKTNPTAKQIEIQKTTHSGGVDYTDCGMFVAAAVIGSGADPDFPTASTEKILNYLSSSDKWEKVPDWDGSESKLQDGDILVVHASGSTHAMIYTGKTSESKGGTWADASQGGHVGIIRNYVGTSYTSTFSAFRLKGDNNCNFSDGLPEEQAQKLADYYNSNEVTVTDFSNKNNCVGFSAFFVSWLTDLSDPSENPTSGDGYAVAGNLISRYNLPASEGPKPYAVFSTSNASFHSANHTGVVVNVNSDGTVTTVESACNDTCDGGDGWGRGFPNNTGNAVVWTNQTLPEGLTYAYLSDHLNSKLNEIINK